MSELEFFEVGDREVVLGISGLIWFPPVKCVVVTTKAWMTDEGRVGFPRLLSGGETYVFSSWFDDWLAEATSTSRPGAESSRRVQIAIPWQVYEEVTITGMAPKRGYVMSYDGNEDSLATRQSLQAAETEMVQGPIAAVKVGSDWVAPEVEAMQWRIIPNAISR